MLRSASQAGEVFEGSFFLADLMLGGLRLGGGLNRRIGRLLRGGVHSEGIGHSEEAPHRRRRASGLGIRGRCAERRLHNRDGQPGHACDGAHGGRCPATLAQTCWHSHVVPFPSDGAGRAGPATLLQGLPPHRNTALRLYRHKRHASCLHRAAEAVGVDVAIVRHAAVAMNVPVVPAG